MPIDNDGTAILPTFSFLSEHSMGFYRSTNSTIAQSYGSTLLAPGADLLDRVTVGGGAFTGKLTVRSPGQQLLINDTADNRSWNITARSAVAGVFYVNSARTPITWDISGANYGFDTASALQPTWAYSSEFSLGLYRSGVSTVAMSYGTLNLAKQAVRLSMRTLAASSVTASAAKTNVAVDEVVFTIGGASGASLIIYSGGTAYGFNSAFSAAAA